MSPKSSDRKSTERHREENNGKIDQILELCSQKSRNNRSNQKLSEGRILS